MKKNIKKSYTRKVKTLSATLPVGNTLQSNTGTGIVVTNSDMVTATQPYGFQVPSQIKSRSSGWSQIANLSNQLDIVKVQAAIRAAERGDTTLLFTYYRDLFISTGMVSTELQKRKLAVLSEPFTILPVDKNNTNDLAAVEAIKDMIENCPTWNESLVHLMNAIVYPIAVSEKIFRPVEAYEENPLGLRYYLKGMYPVDYTLVNYRLPYLPQGPLTAVSNNMGLFDNNVDIRQPWFFNNTNRPEDTIYNVDSWEPDLRFWHVLANGLIDYSWSNIYAPDPNRHFVYRSNLLNGIARDNFGGNGRALLFWSIMAQAGREIFLRLLNRYGIPFMVAKVDTSQVDVVEEVSKAFDTATILNGLILNKDAILELQAINLEGAAKGNEMFCQFCFDQISLLISGITLGSHAKATGLGSGVAALQSQVRNDILSYDRLALGTALKTQLFSQFLKINGIKGRSPTISWGGGISELERKDLSISLTNLKSAGLEPSDDALTLLSEKYGFQIQRSAQSSPIIPNEGNNNPINGEDQTSSETNMPEGEVNDEDKFVSVDEEEASVA